MPAAKRLLSLSGRMSQSHTSDIGTITAHIRDVDVVATSNLKPTTLTQGRLILVTVTW